MAIPLEALKHFQSANLEQSDAQTNVRSPKTNMVVEWALVEIVLLLTGIRANLRLMSSKRT
jgi:hypothetical protein